MALPSRDPSRFPSYPDDTGDTSVRRRDVSFQSVADVEARVRDRRAVLDGAILTIASTGAQYVLRDAMRVLGSGHEVDVFGMTGRVLAISELLSMGACVSAASLRIGTIEYEVQPGYLVQALAFS